MSADIGPFSSMRPAIGPEKRSSGIGQPEEGAHRQDEFRRPSAGCAGYADKLVGEDRDVLKLRPN